MKLYVGTNVKIWNKKAKRKLEKDFQVCLFVCLSSENNTRERTADVV
jgi:hypothetical protein